MCRTRDLFPLSPLVTSSHSHDDACIHGSLLFVSFGLFCVRADQLSEGNGGAGGNLPSATI